MSRDRLIPLVMTAIILCLPPVAEAMTEPFWIAIGTRILVVAIAVVSLDLVLGYAGLPSFGHAAFFGLGAFTVAILADLANKFPSNGLLQLLGTEGSVGWLAAVMMAALFGLIFGALALRTRGVHFLMITLAFSQMLYFLFISLPSYGGDEGLRLRQVQTLFGFSIAEPKTFYYVTAVLLLLTIAGVRVIVGSRFGQVLLGCQQNERRMKFLGYRTNLYLLAAFVLSAAGTGLAGALLANHLRYVSPHMLSWFQSGEFMIMSTLGGLATTYGGVLGAAVFIILHEVFLSFTEYWEVVLGIGLLILVFASPGGLLRLMSRMRSANG